MKKHFLGLVLSIASLLLSGDLYAQAPGFPELLQFNFTDGSAIRGISNNGLWGVAFGVDPVVDNFYANPKLLDFTTGKVTDLSVENASDCAAMDVTDDGRIVVGVYQSKPAIYMNGTWRNLPLPQFWEEGRCSAITPDGHYAVGRAAAGFVETAIMWDLEAGGVLVETPNIPLTDLAGEDNGQTRFTNISDDGRYIAGVTSFSYSNSELGFVYDRETATYKVIGYDQDPATGRLTPRVYGFHHPDLDFSLSGDGKLLSGMAYMVKPNGTEIPEEYWTTFVYDLENDVFTVYDEPESRDISLPALSNAGIVFGASPAMSPSRSLYVRSGKYWIPLSLLLSQRYGVNFYAQTGYEFTGTPIGVSNDGRTLAAIAYYRDDNYVLRLPETFAEAAASINLLADYTITPAAGSNFSRLSTVQLTFTQQVQVLKSDGITLTSSDGSVSRAATSCIVTPNNPRSVTITFRTTTMTPGVKYTVTIPAGSICISGDDERINEDIIIQYAGREDAPVRMTAVSPEEGLAVTQMNSTNNPVILTFDTDVQIAETASAVLYRNDESDPFCHLQMIANANRIAIYPNTVEYLFKDNTYRLHIAAGSVTDIMGNNGNEDIDIRYEGAYVREIVFNDTVLYNETFNGGLQNVMLYDGDKLTPTAEMQAWDFTNLLPWMYVSDDISSYDFAAASHSCYEEGGKSDDWLVTPQIYIPNSRCTLSFQAQSYRKDKQDRLKVIIWASERVLNDLTKNDVEQIRTEGTVVYNELESPGENEELLAGEWATHYISLEEYAGKSIYVAFVNENENQSAIFIDNVRITRNQDFFITLSTPTTTVASQSEQIAGYVTVNSGTQTFTDITLTLLDNNKTALETISETGLSLNLNDRYEFAFNKSLPLEVGKTNEFAIRVQMNETVDTMKINIKNLSFDPVKYVVIEEITGMSCQHCPLGVLALENLEKIYGKQIIPVAYHTYAGGDTYGSGLADYTTYLGLSAAPAAVINRSKEVYAPMVSTTTGGNTTYSFRSPYGDCWLDIVEKELEQSTDAEITTTSTYDSKSRLVTINNSVKYAINADNVNVSLLLIVTEDNLAGAQLNGHFNENDPALGEWGLGGIYGQNTVYPYYYDDVARGLIGETNIGTGGLIPTQVEAEQEYTSTIQFQLPNSVKDAANCHVICMMIDANTGAYINASRTVLDADGNAIVDTSADEASNVAVSAAGQTVNVSAPDGAEVTVYGVNGSILGAAVCNGGAQVALAGYKGVAIVRVKHDSTTVVKKVMIK